MDIKTLVSSLLTAENLKSLSNKTGVTEAQVKDVLGSALPKLLDGVDLGDSAQLKKLAVKLMGSDAKNTVADASKKAGISAEKGNELLTAAASKASELLGKENGNDLGSLIGGLTGGKKDVDLGDALGKVGKLFGK